MLQTAEFEGSGCNSTSDSTSHKETEIKNRYFTLISHFTYSTLAID